MPLVLWQGRSLKRHGSQTRNAFWSRYFASMTVVLPKFGKPLLEEGKQKVSAPLVGVLFFVGREALQRIRKKKPWWWYSTCIPEIELFLSKLNDPNRGNLTLDSSFEYQPFRWRSNIGYSNSSDMQIRPCTTE